MILLAGAIQKATRLQDSAAAFDKRFDLYIDALLPWLAKERQDEARTGGEMWQRAFGSMNDPKTRRLVNRQIQALKEAASG